VRKVADPIEFFGRWFEEAKASEPKLADACCLATADADGRPSARYVLLKGFGDDGFDFYTNYDSPKAHDLDANPRACLAFHWKSLDRQLRVDGPVARMSAEDSDAYFASRDRVSRIGAWASLQSKPMEGRFEFEQRIARYTARYAVGAIPRPEGWGGYRLRPERVEFWEDRKFRLHVRHVYTRTPGGWDFVELYP
jgi:pyridoxamine 5'-phosphate oxidase